MATTDGGYALPRPLPDIKVTPDEAVEMIPRYSGLTKREWFAGLAISPMLVQAYGKTPDILAAKAVEIADALLAALAETEEVQDGE